MIPKEITYEEKRGILRNAGWRRGQKNYLWYAPNCTLGQSLDDAWQAFLLGKRCEQPLVNEMT